MLQSQPMTKKLEFPIQLTYDPVYKGWVAECLTLYGCMSQGKTKEEAMENVDKAIKAYMEALEKETKGNFATRKVEVSVP